MGFWDSTSLGPFRGCLLIVIGNQISSIVPNKYRRFHVNVTFNREMMNNPSQSLSLGDHHFKHSWRPISKLRYAWLHSMTARGSLFVISLWFCLGLPLRRHNMSQFQPSCSPKQKKRLDRASMPLQKYPSNTTTKKCLSLVDLWMFMGKPGMSMFGGHDP